MDIQRAKRIGGAAALAAIVGVAGFFYGTSTATPELVSVSSVGCGLTAGAGNFDVPLITVGTAAPAMTVSYGILELPATNQSFRFNFDHEVDGNSNEVVLIGDTLNLPVSFGRNQTAPTSIRINCRDGAVATVRYQRDRANATFNVVHQAVSEAVEERVQPASTEG